MDSALGSYAAFTHDDLFYLHHQPLTNQNPPAPFINPLEMSKSDEGSASDGHSVKSEGDSRSNSFDSATPASSPAPQSMKKKRKSWGQVLPLPTTNLPPRKRAKTEAEKEQRKYERVQRNRAAAHQSRMRKQEEKDRLEMENNILKQDCQSLRDEVTRLNEEVQRLRQQKSTTSSTTSTLTHTAPALQREPSLTHSMSSPSSDHEIYTPPMSPPDTVLQMEGLKSNNSHSAAMCSQQWMLDHQDSSSPLAATLPTSFPTM